MEGFTIFFTLLGSLLICIYIYVFILIYICGGAIVFGFYYLLYKRTIKKKNVVKSSLLVVRIAFVMGCVNTLLGIISCIYLVEIVPSNSIFFIIGLYYFVFAIPISLASIAVSFKEREKKLITGKRFVTVALIINIVCFALALVFFCMVHYMFIGGV